MMDKMIRLPHKGSFFLAEYGQHVVHFVQFLSKNKLISCQFEKKSITLPIVLLAAIQFLSINN